MKQDLTNLSVTQDSYECTITVDCAVYGFQDGILKLLLVKRASDVYEESWLLPGGIVQENQTAEEAASHVLYSLTDIDNVHHEQVKIYSDINRHPVKRVITVCFYALVKPENHPVIAKKNVSEIKWFPIDQIPQMSFDHNQLAQDSLEKLKVNLESRLLLGELLPEKFTLKELQDLYEAILEESLDRRNFRKRLLQKGLIDKVGEKKQGVKGGPDLYKWKKE